MSADLFAEFATDAAPNQQQQPAGHAKGGQQPAPSFSFFDDLKPSATTVPQAQAPSQQQHFQSFSSAPTQAAITTDDDDWGDFEGGTSEQAPPTKQDPFAFGTPRTSQPQQNTWNIAPATSDPFAYDLSQQAHPSQDLWQRAPVVKAKKPADSSVLFDAEDDFEDDDEFGDFEGTEETATTPAVPKVSQPASSALVDLLGDLSVSHPQPPRTDIKVEHEASKRTSLVKKGPSASFGNVSKSKQPSVTPAAPATKEEDAWDTFDDWEASIPTKAPAKITPKAPDATKTTIVAQGPSSPAPILSPTADDVKPGELPPTNVPPPGVLLSLFPSLFAEAQEKLFKPMAAQTLPMRNKLLAEPATITYLRGYLILANVAAHVIAGRKLRWKRDQHLSQGMRIGPASSRATSGMKLTGIDKGENLKEEREVSDVVRVWREQVGRLRHVVSGVNQIKSGTLGQAPDLQEVMPVKTLKQSEGGIPARQPCMMCGLKREERVTASDTSIVDSFGEWWIDQVNMHRGE